VTLYLPRSAWTTVPKPDALTSLDPDDVEGLAVHWPGTTTSVIGERTREGIANLLEGYRRFHVSGRGWTDIAYQVAIDQAGRVWDLRGIEHRSAANGDTGPNQRWGALLLLLGADERPSAAMVAAVRAWRDEKWLNRYPKATRVVRHKDVRPDGTDCPGPHAGALVLNGTFTKQEDDDVDWNQKVKLDQLQADTLNLTRPTDKHFAAGDEVEVGWLITWGGARGAQIYDAVKDLKASAAAAQENTAGARTAAQSAAAAAQAAAAAAGRAEAAIKGSGPLSVSDAQLATLAGLLAPAVAAALGEDFARRLQS